MVSIASKPYQNVFIESKEELKKIIYNNNGNSIIVAYIDIDNFKYINDLYGYEVGNRIIINLGLRLIEIGKGSFEVFKLNADEFILIFKNYSMDRVIKIIDNVIKICKELYIFETKEIITNISVGIYEVQSKEALSEILRKAELAMHMSKMNGKSRFTIYTKDIEEYMKRKTRLILELKKAINNDEFYVLYQPIYDLKEKKIKRVEALARWKNNILGEISPAEFIPVLEELDMINEFGNLIIEKIFKQMKKWSGDNLDINVNINISPLQLKYFHTYDKLKLLKDKYQIDFKRITFELTEGQLKELDEEDKNTLMGLKDMGAKISLDDFGRGYSQLFNLFTLPINEIKIDRDIIKIIEDDYRTRKMLECFIKLTKEFGYDIVGEGVETKSQLMLLNEMECDYIQGYLISRPLNGEDIYDLLNDKAGI